MPDLVASLLAPRSLLAGMVRSVEVFHACGRQYDEHADGLCPAG